MNIHFVQVERKSQLPLYLLALFAVSIALMLTLNISSHARIYWSDATTSGQVLQTTHSDLWVAIPAPMPPVDQVQPIATPESTENIQSILVAPAIAAPMPSVP